VNTKNTTQKVRSFIKRQFGRLGSFTNQHKLATRITSGVLAFIIIFSIGYQTYEWRYGAIKYNLSAQAETLLGETNEKYATKLKLDNTGQKYTYNEGYVPGVEKASTGGGPRFTAEFDKDPKKGMTIKDSSRNTSVTFKAKYKLDSPMKQDNRLIYPFSNGQGAKVVTAKAANIKEDIILEKSQGDAPSYKYDIVLPDELEVRIENDGSLGIYGPGEGALFGQASTGSDKDAKLLEKAKKKAEKNVLVFRTPAPFVIESNKKISNAKAWFGLKGKELTVHTSGLKNANYPLTIDPSVYVETASKLMRGNNETNLDFDVDNELIQKGKLTGARFDSWSTTNMKALNSARWNHGTAVMGGYAYVVGGSSGSSNVATIYWAKFNTTSYVIESPNPGAGACTDWCTNSAYDLPAARAGASLVAYNGFLYLIGGVDSSGNRASTVYIAKIGANGEPSLWHPTGGTAVYWHSSSSTLSTATGYGAAVAYNNKLYYLGGHTSGSTGGVTTVVGADLKPTGDISAWSATGMTVLSSARHNHNVQVYNDRLYVIGGNSSDTLQSSVAYIKLASDGTMSGSWQTTSSFTTARMAWGGNFITSWGGYIYLAGGCSAVNASGYCTTIASDIQLASINADGTLAAWETISGLTNSRIGYGLVGWRGNLYGIGGCTAQNTSTGDCTTTSTTTNRGLINTDGDASTVSNSVPDGTSPCVSSTYYDCDIPPEGTSNGQGGNMSGGVIVNNGYVYYIGGCTAVAQNSVCFTGNAGKTSDNIYYSAIASDGTLVRPSSCSYTWYGSWCVDGTNTINSPTGLAAFGYTVFNNVIYITGGTTGVNSTGWKSDVWRVGLNVDGSLSGAWSSQTFTDLNLGSGRGYSYVFTRSNPGSASTYPGNLYILGGCSSTSNGLDCATTNTEVYKCNIKTDGSLETTDGSDCSTTNQLQIDSEPGTSGSQGLGAMAGAVYANYVYLVGGQSPNESERGQVMYAKIDNSNNIVAVTGSIWQTSSNTISPVRRRGIAFGYNGYMYALAGWSGTSGLQDLLFAKINVSDGSIGAFTTSAVTVTARWDLRAAVNNGWVYALGGCGAGAPPASCTSMIRTVQTFQLYNNNSGSARSYTASSNLFTTDRLGAGVAVLNGYIYIAGGCTSTTDCTTATDNVQYASIDSYGTIGTWANTTDSTLPGARAFGQLEAAGGTLYFIGGQGSTSTDESADVYYGTPSSGNVSSWADASNDIPAARTQHSAAVWNNRIYVTGGKDSSATATSTVYISPQLNSGGDITSGWSTSGNSFNVARSGHTAITYANNLYILGGHDGTYYLNDVQYTQINTDGTLDSFSYTTNLPQGTRQADGFAVNGFMYIFGGRSADTTCTNFTYAAPISANTTIATGNNPTGIGDWYSNNQKFTTNRYGVSAVYYDGKAYVLGGACGATLTYSGANRVSQSTLQSQPQVAKYSKMIDTDTDVFPTKWLMNGLDNSIGARWYMNYKSSTAATAAWGQNTNFGVITLGNPETYIPKDSGGTNTNFARYYYMAVNIDSQQAFGYPEDVARGPTIADLSLFFTSDPSKRMRHGKTFTGGEQQPLDTPF
jgi:N-acetylneuraminic acid mutarotase